MTVLVTTVPPEAKGGIFAIHQLLQGKSPGKGIDMAFFPVGSPDPFREPVAGRLLRVFARAVRFSGLLARNRAIRVVHVNTAYDPKSLARDALFVAISRLFRKKVLLQVHHSAYPTGSRLIGWITRHVFPLCDRILVFSRDSKRYLESVLPGKSIEIFPNPVVVGEFRGTDRTLRRELSIPDEAGVVLFLSRLIEGKGVCDIIESIPEVVAAHPDACFVFAGEGPDRPRMEAACREKGVGEHVRFTGHIRHEDVIRAFGAADIFVLPTCLPEGMPMSILQALAAGLPIVSTRISSIPDILEDGRNGFLIEPHSPGALAEKISQLLRDKGLRARMGEANRELAEEKYDLDIVLESLGRLYAAI